MGLPVISITQEMLSRFEEVIQKEWLITNGLGGYASSTVPAINTRKYHGLLVAALNPPGNRTVCLSKLDEEVSIANNTYPLGANEFQNVIFPKGYNFLKEFSVSPFPKYTYSVDNVQVEKTIFMPNGKNAVVALYKILNRNDSDVKIQIFPLVSCRHYHSVVDRWRDLLEFVQKPSGKGVELQFNIPKVALVAEATDGQFQKKVRWVERLYYREEALRGESNLDDCYQPGHFEIEASANRNKEYAIVTVADESVEKAREILDDMRVNMYNLESLFEKELSRRQDFLTNFYALTEKVAENNWLNWILLATDTFIAKGSGERKAVLAGYYWFESWGRDTFVSLPGLLLVTRRFEEAKKVLLDFAKYCKDGLIPNFVQDKSGEPVYNTVDATFWFVNAVLQYLKYTGDFKFVDRQLWETLEGIVENHERGTAYGIHVDNDGLLAHGPRLTWMDAEADGQAITPRAGKAVEIQALWYNALKVMELLAEKFDEKEQSEKYHLMAEKTRKSFAEKFWNPEKNCLFDVVNEHGNDASLRPNQIIAVALDFTMLDGVRNEKIVDLVHREFLTPYGLCTLSRSDPKYVGVCVGDRRSRDQAYHNGTVWPWLNGPFIKAFLKTKGYVDYRLEYALKNFVLPLFSEQVLKAGLGTLSEIFDGDPPHAARGCVAQAWSIAEPFRAYVEDVLQVRPERERDVAQVLG
jgi:predicted glycogen debranching enzyme